jgi:basic membrane protein A and related proteins
MGTLARSRLAAFLLASLGLAFVVSSGGCKKKKPAPAPEATETVAAPEPPAPRGFVVAVLYGGPKLDAGFNQAHAAAAAAVKQLPGVTVVEEEDVPDGPAAGKVIEKVVLAGAKVVFATGWGQYDPPVLDMARKHPQVSFLHCGGYYREGEHPPNVTSFHGYIDEGFYVAGMAAGLTSKTGKLGFIASRGIPHVVRAVNAFTLGARAASGKVTTNVVFTDSWSDQAAELEAANRLLDQQSDVLAAYVNAPAAILGAAEGRGAWSVGVHVDGRAHAPKGYLTGAESRWEKIYVDAVEAARAGKSFPRVVRGGLGAGTVTISPFGPAVSAATQERAMEARTKLASGQLVIFKGPLKDQSHKPVLTKGVQMIQQDVRLELMGYLVEGVNGAMPE